MDILKNKNCDLSNEKECLITCNSNNLNNIKCQQKNINDIEINQNDKIKCSKESIIYGILMILVLIGIIILLIYVKNIILIIIGWVVLLIILTVLFINFMSLISSKNKSNLFFPYTPYGIHPHIQINE